MLKEVSFECFLFVKRNLRTIVEAFDNVILSSCLVFCEHCTIALPTSSCTVRIRNFPFFCFQSPGILASSCSISLVTLTFLITSSSAPRCFNQSQYGLRRFLRKNTDICWSSRILSWATIITSDRQLLQTLKS